MKISEAKKIISAIINWQFVLQGIHEREQVEKIDLSGYSLQDLLHANNLVKSSNKRKQSLQQYNSKKGNKTKGISIHLTAAERLIAGVYTALHFQPDGEMVVLINDKGVGVVKANYN